MRLAVLTVLGLLFLARPARAQEATLRRDEDAVVLQGRDVPRVLRVKKDRLRLYAWKKGALKAIPLQVDERTPQSRYCFDKGPEPRSDVDEGAVDENDELVFSSGDAGGRPPQAPRVPGSTAQHEIELTDPIDGGKAWVYLVAFEGDPPAGPAASAVDFDVDRDGAARLKGKGFELGLSFPAAGGHGPARVLLGEGEKTAFADVAAIELWGSFRGLSIKREPDEVRVAAGSWLTGPVRALVELTVETYVVWGSWIHTPDPSKSVAQLTRSVVTLPASVALPCDLDATAPSGFSVALVPAGSGPPPRGILDQDFARRGASNERGRRSAWIALSGPSGLVAARLAPRDGQGLVAKAKRDGSALALSVDLAGATKGDYAADFTLLVRGPAENGVELVSRELALLERPLEKRVK